jgi:hypothetical protein
LVPFGYPGVVTLIAFPLNMYTSPALFSFIIYLFLFWVIVYKFHEYVVLDVNVINQNKPQNSNPEDYAVPSSIANLPPPDYVAIALSLFLFFFNCFIFSFLET